MRKKLFTLMTLLLTAVTGAWAQTTLFSMSVKTSISSETSTDQTEAEEGTPTAYALTDYADFGVAGTSAVFYKTKAQGTDAAKYIAKSSSYWFQLSSSGNKVYYQINLATALAKGDIISFDVKDTKKDKNIGLYFNKDAAQNSGVGAHVEGTNSGTISNLKYTVTDEDGLAGKTTIYAVRVDGTGTNFNNLTITRPETKTISTQTFAGVKVDGTALTENDATDGYSISSTTITLSDDILYLSTPNNITLTNHITYTDETSEDDDIIVTFDGTVEGVYYIGTATIGTTDYTVKAKKDTTPTLTLSSASGTISLKSYQPTGTVKVTVTGTNLANGTFTAPTASGVTVAPASVDITDGTIDQEFTITSSATTAASTDLAFAYTGVATQDYTLNYTKTAQRSLAQSDVSAATTWDWSKAYDAADVQLTDATSPTKSEEFLLSNLAEVKNDANFNAQALSVVCEYATRKSGSDYMLQGNSVKFNTTVPGTIKVVFSNTGGDRPYRYLTVNGVPTEFKSGTSSKVTSGGIYVPAGEVEISGYIVNASDPQTRKGDNVGATMLRFYKIEFEPLEDADAVTVTSAGYATVVLTKDAYFEATPEVTAYAAKAAGTKVTLTEVKAAPAGTPLVIKAAADTYTLKKATSIAPAAVEDNDLEAGPVTDSDGTNYYVLGKEGSKVGFGLLASGVNLDGTKAYIAASKFAGAPGFITIEGADDDSDITTGISAIEHSTLNIEHSEVYNLNGQRVSQPTKGLYIVNGKKVVVK